MICNYNTKIPKNTLTFSSKSSIKVISPSANSAFASLTKPRNIILIFFTNPKIDFVADLHSNVRFRHNQINVVAHIRFVSYHTKPSFSKNLEALHLAKELPPLA